MNGFFSKIMIWFHKSEVMDEFGEGGAAAMIKIISVLEESVEIVDSNLCAGWGREQKKNE